MTTKQSTCRNLVFGLILASYAGSGCSEATVDRPTYAAGQVVGISDVERDIRAVLEQQVTAWNQGSIRRFMDGYARTDSLRFASGGDVWYGWDETLARYERNFAGDGLMGTLSFDSLKVDVLSAERALVFGRWRLDRTGDVPDAGGLFTLLFGKRSGAWRIIYDHTSSALPETHDVDPNDHQDNG